MRILLPVLCVLLAACAEKIPRAIIPPPPVVRELNVKPVSDASKRTRDAVREVGRNVDSSTDKAARVSEDAQRLKDVIAKAREEANGDVAISLAAADAIADGLLIKIKELRESLRLAAGARDIAIATVDDQQKVIGEMAIQAEGQAAEIRRAKEYEVALHTEFAALAKLPDKLAILDDKLGWWRNAALLTWGLIVSYLIIKFFGAAMGAYIRTRIPI